MDLCKILVQRFSRSELKGVQDFSGGRFEVVFASKAAVDRFLADPVVEIMEQKVRFEFRGSRVKIVRVLNYAIEDPEDELRRALGAYGQVHAIQKESVPGFPETYSGTRRVRMEMLRDVPNILKVHDKCSVRCEYEGVVRQCIRCSGTGHHAAACTTPKCKRCEQFGHENCEAPCANCQGDHARSACRVRSFARVVGQAPNSSDAAALEETVSASAPDVASVEPNASDDAERSSAGSRGAVASATPEGEAREPDEEGTKEVSVAAMADAPVPAVVEEAAEVAPPLAAEGKPTAAAGVAAASVAPPLATPKKRRRKPGKRRLFADEEKTAGSKTGLRKASDSDEASTLSSSRSPARQKRAVSPSAVSSGSDAEFSSTDDDVMEAEQSPKT